MRIVTTVLSATAAIAFACLIAAAVVSLWKAPLHDPDAP
jgi:hypothetical protein